MINSSLDKKIGPAPLPRARTMPHRLLDLALAPAPIRNLAGLVVRPSARTRRRSPRLCQARDPRVPRPLPRSQRQTIHPKDRHDQSRTRLELGLHQRILFLRRGDCAKSAFMRQAHF